MLCRSLYRFLFLHLCLLPRICQGAGLHGMCACASDTPHFCRSIALPRIWRPRILLPRIWRLLNIVRVHVMLPRLKCRGIINSMHAPNVVTVKRNSMMNVSRLQEGQDVVKMLRIA